MANCIDQLSYALVAFLVFIYISSCNSCKTLWNSYFYYLPDSRSERLSYSPRVTELLSSEARGFQLEVVWQLSHQWGVLNTWIGGRDLLFLRSDFSGPWFSQYKMWAWTGWLKSLQVLPYLILSYTLKISLSHPRLTVKSDQWSVHVLKIHRWMERLEHSLSTHQNYSLSSARNLFSQTIRGHQ